MVYNNESRLVIKPLAEVSGYMFTLAEAAKEDAPALASLLLRLTGDVIPKRAGGALPS